MSPKLTPTLHDLPQKRTLTRNIGSNYIAFSTDKEEMV